MTKIEDTVLVSQIQINELLKDVDLGKLHIVESRTGGQDMSEELLGVISAPVDDTPSMSGLADP